MAGADIDFNNPIESDGLQSGISAGWLAEGLGALVSRQIAIHKYRTDYRESAHEKHGAR